MSEGMLILNRTSYPPPIFSADSQGRKPPRNQTTPGASDLSPPAVFGRVWISKNQRSFHRAASGSLAHRHPLLKTPMPGPRAVVVSRAISLSRAPTTGAGAGERARAPAPAITVRKNFLYFLPINQKHNISYHRKSKSPGGGFWGRQYRGSVFSSTPDKPATRADK